MPRSFANRASIPQTERSAVTREDAEGLARAREAYAYLPARLAPAGDARPDIEIWDTLRLKIESPDPLKWGTREGRENHRSIDLDRYHQDLLLNRSDDRLLQGLASVHFWGFAYGLDGRDHFAWALGKVKNLRDGYGALPNQRANEILGYLRTARTCLIENKDPARALKAAMEIRFLGMSFASKVLAFMDPLHCGIYDSRISEKLEKSPDPDLRRLYVPARGDHHHRRELQAEVYADWCSWCTRKAGEINATGVKWRDWDGSLQDWRAIDVERSIFASPFSFLRKGAMREVW